MKKTRICLRLLSLVLMSLLVSQGCLKVDQPPALRVTVLDQWGEPVDGAVVGLFESYDTWKDLEYPAQVWRSCDRAGQVVFFDLQEIPYYIYARKGDVDNSLDEIQLTTIPHKNVILNLTIRIR